MNVIKSSGNWIIRKYLPAAAFSVSHLYHIPKGADKRGEKREKDKQGDRERLRERPILKYSPNISIGQIP